jgi:gentisate 1,2-dioxygenase
MSTFSDPDLVPLWDRPPEFLPLRPPGGSYRWRYQTVRSELLRVADSLDKADGERRVALLANPALTGAAATDGLHAGIQLLRGGESAAAHRHTPSALRVGLEGSGIVTTVGDTELPLEPLDVVLNPSGTWHGHVDRGGDGGVWLDVVDLPLVAGVGGVLFEPTRQHRTGSLLDPPSVPPTVRYPWEDMEAELAAQETTGGVRQLRYGGGTVMPTMAVTSYAFEAGATLQLPARTASAIVIVGRGRLSTTDAALDTYDVTALRSWTPYALTSHADDSIALVIDTSPALRALGLYREEQTP